jgi:hypothetical protein
MPKYVPIKSAPRVLIINILDGSPPELSASYGFCHVIEDEI